MNTIFIFFNILSLHCMQLDVFRHNSYANTPTKYNEIVLNKILPKTIHEFSFMNNNTINIKYKISYDIHNSDYILAYSEKSLDSLPSNEFVNSVCLAYANRGGELNQLRYIVGHHGWTMNEFYRNYGQFRCLRGSQIPLVWHITQVRYYIDGEITENDLDALKAMSPQTRHNILNHTHLNRTQLDILNLYYRRILQTPHANESHRRAVRGIISEFIAIGALTGEELAAGSVCRGSVVSPSGLFQVCASLQPE